MEDRPAQPAAQEQQSDFVDVDAFLDEATSRGKDSADTVINEATGAREVPVAIAQEPAKPPMDETEALKQAGIMMDMRETAQALGLSWMAEGHVKEFERFKYEPWAKQLLKEAWAPVIQDANIRVNKLVRVLYAEGIATTPLVMLGIKARKLRLENEQLKAQLVALQRQAAQPAAVAQAPAPAAAAQPTATPPAQRPPDNPRGKSKTAWKIDNNGLFEHTTSLQYLKIHERTEKPLLTPENYELLCQHNGKEKVDRIFNIPAS